MRNVAIAVDRPTVPVGFVALVLKFNAGMRDASPETRVAIRTSLWLVATTPQAVLVAVCPVWRYRRQKHDDGQQTGKSTRVGNIKFHNATLSPRSYILNRYASEFSSFSQYGNEASWWGCTARRVLQREHVAADKETYFKPRLRFQNNSGRRQD